MSKKFVVVVDAQVDFEKENGKLYVPGAEGIIEAQNAYLKALKKEDVEGVLYTFDTHMPEAYPESPEGKMFPPHCYLGEDGWQLAVTDQVAPPVWKLKKGVFNMWEEPNKLVRHVRPDTSEFLVGREYFFSKLKQDGVTEVDVIGVALNFCVLWAVQGLVERGFKVNVYKDLTKGIDTGKGSEDMDPNQVFAEQIKVGTVTVL